MNWQNVATIACKDLTVMLSRRTLRIGLAALPLGLAVLFSTIIARGNIPADVLPRTLNSFLFFFMIYTGALPASIASYSLVGEKVERSLEPLLATPATDSEILLGKTVAALVPPLALMAVGFSVLWSARVSEVRTAQQLGALAAIPGAAVYIALITGAFTLNLASVGVMCGVLVIVDA